MALHPPPKSARTLLSAALLALARTRHSQLLSALAISFTSAQGHFRWPPPTAACCWRRMRLARALQGRALRAMPPWQLHLQHLRRGPCPPAPCPAPSSSPPPCPSPRWLPGRLRQSPGGGSMASCAPRQRWARRWQPALPAQWACGWTTPMPQRQPAPTRP